MSDVWKRVAIYAAVSFILLMLWAGYILNQATGGWFLSQAIDFI